MMANKLEFSEYRLFFRSIALYICFSSLYSRELFLMTVTPSKMYFIWPQVANNFPLIIFGGKNWLSKYLLNRFFFLQLLCNRIVNSTVELTKCLPSRPVTATHNKKYIHILNFKFISRFINTEWLYTLYERLQWSSKISNDEVIKIEMWLKCAAFHLHQPNYTFSLQFRKI